jgi:hypothetical protein
VFVSVKTVICCACSCCMVATPLLCVYTQRLSVSHSLTGATTHVGSWPTQATPSTNSVLGPAPPVSYSQPFCIPHHSIHPSEVWPPHSPSTLQLIQGDFSVSHSLHVENTGIQDCRICTGIKSSPIQCLVKL